MGYILLLGIVLTLQCSVGAFVDSCLSSRRCGVLQVQYPFSFSPQCSESNYTLFCDNNIPYFNLTYPRLQVLEVTWNSLVLSAASLVVNTCTMKTVQFMLPSSPPSSPFALSEENSFFTAGCNVNGNITSVYRNGVNISTGGCRSLCQRRSKNIRRPFCKDLDCCVTTVPDGGTNITMTINHDDSDVCGYANIIYPTSYHANGTYESYGIHILWYMVYGGCEQCAQHQGAMCEKAPLLEFSQGINCRCPDQFIGDGYNNGTGCQDVGRCPQGFFYSDSHCKIKKTLLLGLTIPASFSVLLVTIWIAFTVRQKSHNLKRSNSRRTKKSLTQLRQEFTENARFFTYKEITKATENFKPTRKLGTGSYGNVFGGILNDKIMVAIKVANNASRPRMQQFLNEVTILSQVNHRYLVKLLGCCIEREVPLLVFEYIPNGTLFDHLQQLRGKTAPLSWEARLRIAIETAEALAYLHTAADPPIFHRDVKSLNILLDDNLMAKVADFGISKLVSLESTHISTTVHGTPGYIDPQYQQTYQLTAKSDVYSFGVVLLELITGQRPVDLKREGLDKNLTSFSLPYINECCVREIVDPRMQDTGPEVFKSIECVGKLAATCLNFDREKRPCMREVVDNLKKCRGPQYSLYEV